MKSYLCVFLCGVLLSIFSSSASALDDPVICRGNEVKVNDDSAGSCVHWTRSAGQHSIAVRGDTLYLVWQDNRNANYDIWFSKSTDKGANWGPNIRVDHTGSSTTDQKYPAIAVDWRGYIYVIWTDGRPNNTYTNIFFSKSTDGGQTFGSDVKVSDYDHYLGFFYWASIAIDYEHHYVFVTWVNNDGIWLTIRSSRSLDDGASFQSSKLVSSWQGYYIHPSLVFDQKNWILYVCYNSTYPTNKKIYCARSTDFGYSWQSPVLAGSDPSNSDKSLPSAAVDTCGNLYVVWSDYRNENWDIYFSKSTNLGQSFISPNIKVNDDNTGITTQGSSSLQAFECGKLSVFFSSFWPSNNWDIWSDISVDGGGSWGNDFSINSYTSNNQDPSTLVINQDGKLFCAWSDDRARLNYHDIYSTWLSLAACDAPQLITPPDNDRGPINRQFIWHSVAGATSYHLMIEELNEEDSVKQIFEDTVLTDTTCFITGLFSRYHWRVAGETIWATGPWSSKFTYTDVKDQNEYIAYPRQFSLFQNYPNPFNPETQIEYVLPRNCQVKLIVFNILGQKVKTLVDEFQTVGYKTAHWDGKDDVGKEVASGVYFYMLKASDFSETKKMILMK